MSLIPPETIEQITAANDIVEVIGGYFPLKRSGPVYKALCPFHQERTPSFTVNPQRQIFKCFGCGAGGSVIRFVMNYENLDFVAAAKKLAERANIKIEQGEMSPEDAARYSMRRRLLALHAEAAEFFHWHLMKKPSAQVARDYLKSRGVGGEIAKSWKLGYAPDEWDAMRDFGQTNGFSEEELVASGLVKPRDEEQPGGEFYDRFRARVMFPICNDTGEVIAFSGRVLEAEAKAAKYVNSPETMLFTKGAVLFGLNKSKRALINAKSAIVCEGQLDLITAFEHGVENVIAPQGTAFTEKQARILKRFVDEVVLCFDADAAGQKAAERSLVHLLAENLLVRVAEMPPGEDPDSMIRGQGADAFLERITAAKDFFDFQIDRLAARQTDFTTPRGKSQTARKLAESVSLVRDDVMRGAIVQRVAQRLEISPAGRLSRFAKFDEGGRSSREPRGRANKSDRAEHRRVHARLYALRDERPRNWILSRRMEALGYGHGRTGLGIGHQNPRGGHPAGRRRLGAPLPHHPQRGRGIGGLGPAANTASSARSLSPNAVGERFGTAECFYASRGRARSGLRYAAVAPPDLNSTLRKIAETSFAVRASRKSNKRLSARKFGTD